MVGNSPCASCKLLRRRCTKDCIFAPYFHCGDPHKFAIVHKVFGASNVSKMLQKIPVHRRADAVSSLVYEATARMRDPVYGCVGAISYLQKQVSQLEMQLAMAQAEAEILCIQMQHYQQASLRNATEIFVEDTVDEKSSFLNTNNLSQILDIPLQAIISLGGSDDIGKKGIVEEETIALEVRKGDLWLNHRSIMEDVDIAIVQEGETTAIVISGI